MLILSDSTPESYSYSPADVPAEIDIVDPIDPADRDWWAENAPGHDEDFDVEPDPDFEAEAGAFAYMLALEVFGARLAPGPLTDADVMANGSAIG